MSWPTTNMRTGSRAGALILGALLSVFTMAHHPEHVDPNGLVGIVHGAMLVLMAVIAFGFAHFALRRGVAGRRSSPG